MSGGLQDPAAVARLRDASRELQRELQLELRAAGQRAARSAQDAIRGAASHHDGTLREEIAATVTVSVRGQGDRVTLRIASVGSKMPPGKSTLNAYADRDSAPRWARWRHPVYGHRDRPWKAQEWPSARGWFTGTMQRRRDRLTGAVREAVDTVAARLDGR